MVLTDLQKEELENARKRYEGVVLAYPDELRIPKTVENTINRIDADKITDSFFETKNSGIKRLKYNLELLEEVIEMWDKMREGRDRLPEKTDKPKNAANAVWNAIANLERYIESDKKEQIIVYIEKYAESGEDDLAIEHLTKYLEDSEKKGDTILEFKEHAHSGKHKKAIKCIKTYIKDLKAANPNGKKSRTKRYLTDIKTRIKAVTRKFEAYFKTITSTRSANTTPVITPKKRQRPVEKKEESAQAEESAQEEEEESEELGESAHEEEEEEEEEESAQEEDESESPKKRHKPVEEEIVCDVREQPNDTAIHNFQFQAITGLDFKFRLYAISPKDEKFIVKDKLFDNQYDAMQYAKSVFGRGYTFFIDIACVVTKFK